MLILTGVLAVAAFTAGHLFHASQTTEDHIAIGRFVILSSMLPMVLLVFASLFFRIVSFLSRDI